MYLAGSKGGKLNEDEARAGCICESPHVPLSIDPRGYKFGNEFAVPNVYSKELELYGGAALARALVQRHDRYMEARSSQ